LKLGLKLRVTFVQKVVYAFPIGLCFSGSSTQINRPRKSDLLIFHWFITLQIFNIHYVSTQDIAHCALFNKYVYFLMIKKQMKIKMYEFLENVTQTESFLFCPKQSFLTMSLDWPTDNVKKYLSFYMRVIYNYSSHTFTGKFSGGGGGMYLGERYW